MAESEQYGPSNDFLVAEFNALQERATHIEDLKAGRVNFLLIIFAAMLATLPSVFENFRGIAVEIMLVIAVVVLVVGLTTLNQVVYYSASVAILYRRAGRIRRWFVEQSLEIAPYVAFAPSDDAPSMRPTSAWMYLRWADGVLLALNSVSAAAVGACVFLLLVPAVASSSPFSSIWISVPIVAIAWASQWYWVRNMATREATRNAKEVHFARSEEMSRRYRGEGSGS